MSEMSDKNKDWRGEERRGKERRSGDRREGDRRLGDRRKIFRERRPFSKLKKKLLIYFVLITFVSLVVCLEMIWEIGEPKLVDQISEKITESHPDIDLDSLNSSGIFTPLKELQIRMLLLLAIVAICIVATLLFFVRDIANPLDGMVTAAKRIRDGNLSYTVPVVSNDEIGQLGDILNDLAVNLQEILLFVGTVNSDLMEIIAEIEKNRPEQTEENQELNEQLDLMSDKIEEIKDMVQAFDYYHVVYDGDHVKGNEPDEILDKFKDLV